MSLWSRRGRWWRRGAHCGRERDQWGDALAVVQEDVSEVVTLAAPVQGEYVFARVGQPVPAASELFVSVVFLFVSVLGKSGLSDLLRPLKDSGVHLVRVRKATDLKNVNRCRYFGIQMIKVQLPPNDFRH